MSPINGFPLVFKTPSSSMTILLLSLIFLLLIPSDANLIKSLNKLNQECGFQPQTILDVGANIGDWSESVRSVFPHATFFLVEGNDRHRSKLAAKKFNFEIALVDSTIRNVTFYKDSNPISDGTGNSIFKENSNSFADATTVQLTAFPIDFIVQKNGLVNVQLLKIDIQGAEILALEGAKNTLKGIDVIVSEVAVSNYNRGAPMFFELHKYFDSIGFAFFDIVQAMRAPTSTYSFLLQFDSIWVKKTSTIWGCSCTGFPNPFLASNDCGEVSNAQQRQGNRQRKKGKAKRFSARGENSNQ